MPMSLVTLSNENNADLMVVSPSLLACDQNLLPVDNWDRIS
jgi:hypothetical protein